MTRLSIALPAAALALLGGLALANTAIAAPAEQPAAPVAEHSLVSNGTTNDGQLPTLPLED